MCHFEKYLETAKILDPYDIPVIVKYDLMLAPFTRNEGQSILKTIASQMHKDEILFKFKSFDNPDDGVENMKAIEIMIKNLNAICWLSMKYPDKIPIEKIKEQMNILIGMLSNSLSTQTLNNKKIKGKLLSDDSKTSDVAFAELINVMKKAQTKKTRQK